MPVFRVPASITWNGPGSPGVNVWSVRTTEASVIVDELEAALTALEAFYDSLTTVLAPGVVVRLGPDIVDRESQEDFTRPTRTSTGASSGGQQAPALQICIGWKTTLRARRGMGRTFIGPLVEDLSSSSDGTPTSTMTSALNNAATTLINASNNATGWAIGVWGLVDRGEYDSNGNLLPNLPHVHRDITSHKINDKFAVLRSRRD